MSVTCRDASAGANSNPPRNYLPPPPSSQHLPPLPPLASLQPKKTKCGSAGDVRPRLAYVVDDDGAVPWKTMQNPIQNHYSASRGCRRHPKRRSNRLSVRRQCRHHHHHHHRHCHRHHRRFPLHLRSHPPIAASRVHGKITIVMDRRSEPRMKRRERGGVCR